MDLICSLTLELDFIPNPGKINFFARVTEDPQIFLEIFQSGSGYKKFFESLKPLKNQ